MQTSSGIPVLPNLKHATIKSLYSFILNTNINAQAATIVSMMIVFPRKQFFYNNSVYMINLYPSICMAYKHRENKLKKSSFAGWWDATRLVYWRHLQVSIKYWRREWGKKNFYDCWKLHYYYDHHYIIAAVFTPHSIKANTRTYTHKFFVYTQMKKM